MNITQEYLNKANLLKECPKIIIDNINQILTIVFEIFDNKDIINWWWNFSNGTDWSKGSYRSHNKTISYFIEFKLEN